MSRKDYVALAVVISVSRHDFKSNEAHARFAANIALTLREDNPRFDFQRFMRAAMPNAWVGTRHSNAWERWARKAEEIAR